HFIDLDIVKSDLPKAVRKPSSAGGLAEGRSSDASNLELPLGNPRFLGSKPLEGGTHLRYRVEPGHLLLDSGIEIGDWRLGGQGVLGSLSYNVGRPKPLESRWPEVHEGPKAASFERGWVTRPSGKLAGFLGPRASVQFLPCGGIAMKTALKVIGI